MTKLIEFRNHKKELLRGLLDNASADQAVVFVHGFERTTIEMKFKNIVNGINADAICWRFDFSGCGLSDGSFSDITIDKLTKELHYAIKTLKKNCPKVKKIILVGHSLAGCVIINFLTQYDYPVEKVVLFAPALNQEKLLRYYFTRDMYRKEKQITWANWARYFDEHQFNLWLGSRNKVRKTHFMKNDYFIENKEKNYLDLLNQVKINLKNILLIESDVDEKVPLESNQPLPAEIKRILVKGADHDFENPLLVKKYLPKVINFILS